MAKVNFKGSPVNLRGDEVCVGQRAPEVTLVGGDLGEFKVGADNAKIEVLVTVPSLDTGVCATETRKFNEKMAGKNAIKLSVISADLPFAMGRFCSTEGIANLRVGSDFRAKEFGEKYGVLIDEGALKGLLARAVFVVKDGVIIHKQIVPEIADEPNYDAVFDAIKSSGGCGCGCGH
ncbi:thiol peroxidase [Campylobacter sp. RM16187]|uniref:thiol peroxidase n=1 Tax=Campylobacter sp. RM16187 TaxID=1660063 RepID=UPI0021B6829E|nr:thiol peroxidase [Campylobacter sp. RM16187]QKG28320.1 lipid hydroperoxide peroxidase [Campylobacter sp. RM16187]